MAITYLRDGLSAKLRRLAWIFAHLILFLTIHFQTAKPVWAQDANCLLIIASEVSANDARAFIEKSGTSSERSIYRANNGYFAISAGLISKDTATKTISQLTSKGEIPDDAFCRPATLYELIEVVPVSESGLDLSQKKNEALQYVRSLWSSKNAFWLISAFILATVLAVGLALRCKQSNKPSPKEKRPSIVKGAAAVAHLKPKTPARPSKILAALGKASVALLSALCAAVFVVAFWKSDIPHNVDAAWLGIGLISLLVSLVSYTILRGKYIMRLPALVIVGCIASAVAYFSGLSPNLDDRMNMLASQLGIPLEFVTQAEPTAPVAPQAAAEKPAQSVADMIFNAPATSTKDSIRPKATHQHRELAQAQLKDLVAQGQEIRASMRADARTEAKQFCHQYTGQNRTAGMKIQALRMIEENRARLGEFVDCANDAMRDIILVADLRYAMRAQKYQLIARDLSIPPRDYQLQPISIEQLYESVLQDVILPEVARFEAYATKTYKEHDAYNRAKREDLRRRRAALINLTNRTAQIRDAQVRAQWQRANPNLRTLTPAEARQFVAQSEAGLLYPDVVPDRPRDVDAGDHKAKPQDARRLHSGQGPDEAKEDSQLQDTSDSAVRRRESDHLNAPEVAESPRKETPSRQAETDEDPSHYAGQSHAVDARYHSITREHAESGVRTKAIVDAYAKCRSVGLKLDRSTPMYSATSCEEGKDYSIPGIWCELRMTFICMP